MYVWKRYRFYHLLEYKSCCYLPSAFTVINKQINHTLRISRFLCLASAISGRHLYDEDLCDEELLVNGHEELDRFAICIHFPW